MRILVTMLREDPEYLAVAKRLVKAIGDRAEVTAVPLIAATLGLPPVDLAASTVDVVITVGGDGTILRTRRETALPILGINAGEVGFLAQIEQGDLEPAVERLLDGEIKVVERLRLGVELNGRALPPATNEAVLHTRQVGKLHTFSLTLGGQTIERYRADGLIVATPLGSTGYSMSAGGPLIDPAIEAFVVVPIAPFQVGFRPMVIPADAELEMTSPNAAGNTLVLDGVAEDEVVGPGDRVILKRAADPGRYIDLGSGFYERIDRKLRRV